MRWLVLFLLLPLAGADTLYLTNEELDPPGPLDGSGIWGISADAPEAGRLMANRNVAGVGWNQEFQYVFQEKVTFPANGTAYLVVGCDLPSTGAAQNHTLRTAGIGLDVDLNGTSIGGGTLYEGGPCIPGDELRFTMPLAFDRVEATIGQVLEVRISLSLTNLREEDHVWYALGSGQSRLTIDLARGDPPLRLTPIYAAQTFTQPFGVAFERDWTTDAENVTVRLHGELDGDIQLVISEPSGSDVLHHNFTAWDTTGERIQTPFNFTFEVKAGFDTEWQIELLMRGTGGHIVFEVLPQSHEPQAYVEPAPEPEGWTTWEFNGTADEPTQDPAPAEGKGSPGPLLVPALLVALALRRWR